MLNNKRIAFKIFYVMYLFVAKYVMNFIGIVFMMDNKVLLTYIAL